MFSLYSATQTYSVCLESVFTLRICCKEC